MNTNKQFLVFVPFSFVFYPVLTQVFSFFNLSRRIGFRHKKKSHVQIPKKKKK